MRGLILVSALHKFVTYLLTYNNNKLICIAQEYQRLQRRWRTESAKTFTHLLTVPDPHGADATRDATLNADAHHRRQNKMLQTQKSYRRRIFTQMEGTCVSKRQRCNGRLMSKCRLIICMPGHMVVTIAVQIREHRVERQASVDVESVHQHFHHSWPLKNTRTMRLNYYTASQKRIPNISAVICTKQCPILILQQKC